MPLLSMTKQHKSSEKSNDNNSNKKKKVTYPSASSFFLLSVQAYSQFKSLRQSTSQQNTPFFP